MGDLFLSEILASSTITSEHDNCRCVVRVRTSMWSDCSGLYSKRSITFLRRKSAGYNLLEEDLSAVGAEEVWPRITNLNLCADGIYEVVPCNESRDWETGCIDDYDFELIEYRDDTENSK